MEPVSLPLRVTAAPDQPAPVPVPVLAAGVAPRSSGSANHVAGSVEGALTDYSDLNACAWFIGGGWELRGPRTAFGRAGMKGVEDAKQRKQ